MDTKVSKHSITERLLACGIQSTQQRIRIAEVLLAKQQHLSADQVMEKVNENQPVVSKATIYNTLGLFAEKGLIQEVFVDPNRVFYDSNTTSHHHIYNVDTGTLTDIMPNSIEISRMPELPNNTIATGVDVIVRVKQLKSLAS